MDQQGSLFIRLIIRQTHYFTVLNLNGNVRSLFSLILHSKQIVIHVVEKRINISLKIVFLLVSESRYRSRNVLFTLSPNSKLCCLDLVPGDTLLFGTNMTDFELF